MLHRDGHLKLEIGTKNGLPFAWQAVDNLRYTRRAYPDRNAGRRFLVFLAESRLLIILSAKIPGGGIFVNDERPRSEGRK